MPWILPALAPAAPAGAANSTAPIIPQFDAPFRLDAHGKPVVVEQGSPEDIGACVYNIVSCTQGSKLNDPSFGIPPLLFRNTPLDLSGVLASVRRLEPRASNYSASDVADLIDASERNVAIYVDAPSNPA